ncbi:MAG: xylanase [Prevotella sp.]|jgi:O-glycosyl hydrolase|nr:xylanase [Prevotella sp.]
MKMINTFLAMLLLSTSFCYADNHKVEKYVINIDSQEQTINHFGASDAWSMRYLGLWPEKQQRQIADWLFSMAKDASGKPRGIGLSLWRFNLGAGSAGQGDASHIQWFTRTGCFLQPDGSYNWKAQQGQRNFLKLAKDRGVTHFLAFLNSAPVYFTKNGLATNTGRDGTMNLRENCYGRFAKFIATSLKGLEQHDSIHFDYISPVNEPDGNWNWKGPKQEGSPATNREIARLVRIMGKQFVRQHVNTKIIVNESSDLRCLMGIYRTSWQRGNTIRTLFSKDSSRTYIGSVPNVAHLIAGHDYWTDTPVQYMHDSRVALRDSLHKYNLKFWASEICIMDNDQEIGGGNGYDFSMKTALYVARIMHYDLVFGNASSWSWWRAVGGDYKDGLLRAYSTPDKKDGHAVDSKLLWTVGNYSRFIRPGAVRYDIQAKDSLGNSISEGATDPYGIMCSAYQNTDGRWTVVAINYSESIKPFHFKTSNDAVPSWQMYRTSNISTEDLAPVGRTNGDTTLPPRSVTTFVGINVSPLTKDRNINP